MEQKNYKLEIVNELLKGRNHVRGIAKILNINHMMASRKMSELLKENAVDCKKEGKNKIYYLKKNIEAKAYSVMSENCKLLNILAKHPNLRRIIDYIQKNNGIKLAVLFGSYAKELAKKNSDIDLFIETTDKRIKQELEVLDSKLNIKIGKYDSKNLLIKEIEKNHVIIKGVELFYEKTRFFE